jgi:hypothetical protein
MMRMLRYFVFGAIGCLCIACKLRKRVVAVEGLHSVYACTNNKLKIAVENCPDRKVLVFSPDGKTGREDYANKGEYYFHPEKPGQAMLYISRRTLFGPRVIDSHYVLVRQFPPAHPTVAGQTGGQIIRALLSTQVAPYAPIECCGFDAHFKIVSFEVIVRRNGKTVYSKAINGTPAQIDGVTHDYFSRTLRNGDSVLFENIMAADCGPARLFEPVRFLITGAETYDEQYLRDETATPEYDTVVSPITGEKVVVKRYPFKH